MALPSRLMGSGVGAQAAQNICGDAATGLTATGTTATDAFQLSAVVNQFSTVAGSTGAKLMPTEAGAMVIVRNSGASTLTLYPATGSTINGAASVAVPAATTVLVFATAGTTWFAMTAAAAVGVFTSITATTISATSLTATGALTAFNATAIPAGGTAGAGVLVSSTANFGVFFGSSTPTLTAAKGSLYLRSDGSSASTRAYINSDGGTTWVSVTTAS